VPPALAVRADCILEADHELGRWRMVIQLGAMSEE